ncbi:Srb4p NDAI_0J00500 [Naumovozyma dairenensis CBS 421]|uniref:Mediator of RNA polymerase II transcription subunit 17 n=1 Tax=Naumovozyma dairenensis (strain ATCC 10597 / BCRC 20456 / CBS 421 / NBRC 0211 / NRRL Y-12639) TaxID=1071378 RepID=G0WGL4_NAUDC|nr:hypothetical protein NDAI_0J00500 [Naumovozyma dairenensis CBS 421]CCD26942.1 hypothetical protein NDAI_0J00500 [Naumovozyma dairenensis CBS 421]
MDDQQNADQKMGINLALDPNLINLTLYNHPTATPLSGSNTSTTEPTTAPATTTTVTDANALASSTIVNNGQSMVKNPYEVYGQMPLSQLIPLILQERGQGFKFVDLSEELLAQEIANDKQRTQLSNTNPQDEHTNDNVNNTEVQPQEQQQEEESNNPDLMDIDMENEPEQQSQLPLNDTSLNTISKENQNENSATEAVGATQNPTLTIPETSLTQEQFIKIRKEMVDNINIAMNETSLSLDFVSLLLSSVRENNANSSMSTFLKKNVPTGTLNSDKVPHVPKQKDELTQLEISNRGWKLKSLNDSRLILKENYNKLNNSLTIEHSFWKKLSNHINSNDIIFKLRDKSTGQRSLGIKYGYEDSGSTYKMDRGVAILRTNPTTGKLELKPFSTSKNTKMSSSSSSSNDTIKGLEKFIRIRIFTKIESEDDYILSGESFSDIESRSGNKNANDYSNNDDSISDEDEDIRAQIENLKKFIIEKELMYQLKKECSHLLSYGVTVENENRIVIELPNEKFEIELLSFDDNSLTNHDRDAPKINDKRANLILITLRMLLVVMFKKNLRNKLLSSKVNKSLNIEKEILLIRPILGSIRHSNYKMLLKKIMKSYVLDIVPESTLEESTLPSSTEHIQDHGNTHQMDRHIVKLTKDITAFDHILNIAKTLFQISLPNKGRITIILESTNYCNAVVNIKYVSQDNTTTFDSNFAEFKEVEEFLHFIISEYVKERN